MPPRKPSPKTETPQETGATAVKEPEQTTKPDRFKGTIKDKDSLQFGLPEFIHVNGEWTTVESYVAQCLTPTLKDTGRKDRDQFVIYDKIFETANMNLDTRKIEGPDDAPVFLGLPWFTLTPEENTLDVHEALVKRGVIQADSPQTWPKLTLIYRDTKGQRGQKRTNCCVYVREEE